jgi:hypothetical protein
MNLRFGRKDLGQIFILDFRKKFDPKNNRWKFVYYRPSIE